MRKYKSILVLGGAGFVGSAFLHKIKDREDIRISVLQRKNRILANEKIKVYKGDIRTFDWNTLAEPPDVVFHFARINSNRFKGLGRKWAALQGKKANRRLINFFKSGNIKPKIIYLSGSLMYGNDSNPIDESHKLNPVSFAREYIIAEKPFIEESVKQNLQVNIVRVPWVIGKDSWLRSFYLEYIAQNKKVPVYGSGENNMSLIALEDVVNTLALFIDKDFPAASINITSGISVTQKEFSQALADKYKVPIRHIPLDLFEKAVREAFESSIRFSSKYDFFEEVVRFRDLEKLLSLNLFLLEDV